MISFLWNRFYESNPKRPYQSTLVFSCLLPWRSSAASVPALCRAIA